MSFSEILILSLFIEATISAIKPLWSEDCLSVTEIVSMGVGVLVAVACRINMLDLFYRVNAPAWLDYALYVMTGIGLGRGPSFLYDVWQRVRALPDPDAPDMPEAPEEPVSTPEKEN